MSSAPLDGTTYWHDSRRPLAALVFVLPLIVAYEYGVLWYDASSLAVRNGADCWMRSWMLDAGLVHPWVLPVALIGILTAWHIAGRHPWRCSLDTLTGMFGESLLFALLLVVVGQSLNLAFHRFGFETLSTGGAEGNSVDHAARAISFLGAGLYEELMFRLALLPACFFGLRVLLLPRWISAAGAVLISSTVFAAAHYLEPAGAAGSGGIVAALRRVAADPAQWYGFSFRLLAGLVFAVLLVFRGFGITVGCHALYDLLAGVLMYAPQE